MCKKVRVSQDRLFKFWTDNDLKLVRLAELIGMSEASINVCRLHRPGSNGQPRVFTRQAVDKINEALPKIAEEIRGCVMTFGSDQTFKNQRGKIYDPALVEPMKRIGMYVNLTAMTHKVLGWTQNKKESVIVTKSSKNYGNISEADADAVNAHLLSIAGVLDGYELVAGESDGASSTSSEN